MRIRTGRMGKPVGVRRTPGAHATVRAHTARQGAIACFAKAMLHLQFLGAAPQLTKKKEAEFASLVERFWATRFRELRKQYGEAATDDVMKVLASMLKKPDKRQ